MKLHEKVAIITGASSGIGKSTATLFAEEGASIVLVGRNKESLETLSNELNSDDHRSTYITADVTNIEECKNVIEKTIEEFGRIDVLVNAAGIIKTGNIIETTVEDWNEMMKVNLDSTFYLMNLAAPHLQKTKGNVVNVSSVTGLRSFPNVLAYCVSKAAVDQLTRCSALELAPMGVRVNSVNPGVVVTNLHKRGGMNDEQYQQFLEHSKTTHPIGRVGEPIDVANGILYLATNDSSWVSGVTLSIDGGRHLTCAR